MKTRSLVFSSLSPFHIVQNPLSPESSYLQLLCVSPYQLDELLQVCSGFIPKTILDPVKVKTHFIQECKFQRLL